MDVLLISLFAVAVLLISAVPGYVLIKKNMISRDCIAGLSKILLYVSNPCLVIYTFSVTPFSVEKLIDIGIFAGLCFLLNGAMLGISYLALRHKSKEPIYRIMTVATTFANCSFFGIPIIEALFPAEAAGMIVYTTVYAQVMNIYGWTVGSAIIAADSKYISLKKIVVSPVVIGLAAALIIYLVRIPLVFDIPGTEITFTLVQDMITIMGRMATPVSMLIMGMRLGTMRVGRIFKSPLVYATIALKQLAMPLLTFAILYFLPLDPMLKAAFYVISACPVASVVLNYSEMLGEGQEQAASMVLAGTILSVATLPIMSLLLGALI